jgi:hypothetical protein
VSKEEAPPASIELVGVVSLFAERHADHLGACDGSAFGWCRVEIGPQRPHDGSESAQLFEVRAAQLAEAARAEWREPQAHPAVVDRVGIPIDQTCFDRAVDEPDHAVVTEQQRIGKIPNRGSFGVRMASDSEQQLVLGRRDADGFRLLLAPPKKLA